MTCGRPGMARGPELGTALPVWVTGSWVVKLQQREGQVPGEGAHEQAGWGHGGVGGSEVLGVPSRTETGSGLGLRSAPVKTAGVGMKAREQLGGAVASR